MSPFLQLHSLVLDGWNLELTWSHLTSNSQDRQGGTHTVHWTLAVKSSCGVWIEWRLILYDADWLGLFWMFGNGGIHCNSCKLMLYSCLRPPRSPPQTFQSTQSVYTQNRFWWCPFKIVLAWSLLPYLHHVGCKIATRKTSMLTSIQALPLQLKGDCF